MVGTKGVVKVNNLQHLPDDFGGLDIGYSTVLRNRQRTPFNRFVDCPSTKNSQSNTDLWRVQPSFFYREQFALPVLLLLDEPTFCVEKGIPRWGGSLEMA